MTRWRVETWRGRVEVAPGLRREGLLLYGGDDEAGQLVGEASPLAGYSGASLASVASELAGWMVGVSLLDVGADESVAFALRQVEEAVSSLRSPQAKHAAEQVLLSQLAMERGISLEGLLGGDPRLVVASHERASSIEEAAALVGVGARCLKVKVGRKSWDEERNFLVSLRAMFPDVALRLDANRAWPFEVARERLRELASVGIEFVEEPVRQASPSLFAALREQTGICLALDESCRDPASLVSWLEAGGVGALVLKPMESGILASMAMLDLAARAEVPVVVTTTLDSPIARRAALAVARCVPPSSRTWAGLSWRSTARPTLQPGASSELLPEPLTVAVGLHANKPAWRQADRRLSFGEVDRWVGELAGGLRREGVRAGDVVHINDGRDLQTVARVFALARLGAVCSVEPQSGSAVSSPREVDRTGPEWRRGPYVSGTTVHLDRPVLRLRTSGSTGTPKVVSIAWRQLAWSAFASAMRLGAHTNDCWLHCLPLHHVGGQLIWFRALWACTSVELVERFDARSCSARLDEGDVSQISLVPAMLKRLLDVRGDRPFGAALRVLLVGGGAVDAALLARCEAMGAPVALTWGMTEASSQLATRSPGDCSSLERGLPPLLHAAVHPTEAGQLGIASPSAIEPWLLSNDRGERTKEGRVRILGRVDDVLRMGGESIDLEEIRGVVASHPAVKEAAVVAIDSARWGKAPGAFVVLREGVEEDESSLAAFASQQLPRAALPAAWRFAASMPRTPLGKIARQQVVSRFAETKEE